MLWVEHLTTMDELRTGIGLRGYGQRDPLIEYKQEAYLLFQNLLATIENTVAKTIFKVEITVQPTQPIVNRPLEYQAPDPDRIGDSESGEASQQSAGQVNNRPQTGSGVTTVLRQKGKSIYDRMGENQAVSKNQAKAGEKIGRNDSCPCGATKPDGRPVKYKHCCGK